MGQEDQTMHELCRRVAAGVPGAREEFAERVAPLMRLLAKRSLASPNGRSHSPRKAAPGVRSASPGRPSAAGGDRRTKIARLSSRLCRSLIEKVCHRRPQPGAETCVYRSPWPTKRGGVAR